jgi:hypothetical protein
MSTRIRNAKSGVDAAQEPGPLVSAVFVLLAVLAIGWVLSWVLSITLGDILWTLLMLAIGIKVGWNLRSPG